MRIRKQLAVLSIVAIALVGAGCRPKAAPAPAACAGASATAAAVVALANQSRASVGLGPLAWNGQLACLAAGWSGHIIATGQFVHRDLAATLRSPGYEGWRTLGENILRGGATMTAEQMHQAWMNSPGHRANILSPNFRYIGVGLAYGNGLVAVTQNFGG